MTDPDGPSTPRRIAVVGAAGHVGLGFSLVLVDAGYDVTGIDINLDAIEAIRGGVMPFEEERGEEYLARALASGRLTLTDDLDEVADAEVVAIVVGTPLDTAGGATADPLSHVLDNLTPHLRAGQLLVLRSTIIPGTTDRARDLLVAATGMAEGQDFDLVYAPERVLEGRCIVELPVVPQLIGAYSDRGFERAEAFFRAYLQAGCWRLTPVEAEIGKLAANVERYIRFAFANELYMLADRMGADAHRLIEAVNRDYPRAAIARPGANVGGPCLPKDSRFFGESMPFVGLSAVAHEINEGMPAYIAERAAALGARRVAVLGVSFKADSDDTRGTLAFALLERLQQAGLHAAAYDPNVPDFTDPEALRDADLLVLMTPHRAFADLEEMRRLVGHADCRVLDIWGFWPAARAVSANGLFMLADGLRA
ncbi:MAG: hypothetical protein CVU47_12680 [Chloroflexi bacterium HGW-Chloroflexi-9]|nr:MAG: hypothetical protein CVU47_12680 [Chloroflexi bacterium HGW-Chloroflexi-9]